MVKKTDPIMSEGQLLRLILSSPVKTPLAKQIKAAAEKKAKS